MVTPFSLLNPSAYNKDEEIADLRLAACHKCPSLKMGICSECGCIMKLKVKIAEASCPLGKWEEQTHE
jgi:hypothetical protein